jgi:hypothetical protein
MSKPTNIYTDFSRELLENFVWQLQTSNAEFERHLLRGCAPDDTVRLAYSFECPSKKAAEKLRDYIHEQASDRIVIKTKGRGCLLRGKTEELGYDLPAILRWVGYMCDAGNGFGCRFDGWSPKRPRPAQSHDGNTPAVNEADGGELSPFPHLVIAKILDNVEPIERGEKYEDPLTAVLKEHGLGEVTGGGTQLNAKRQVEHVDLEIRLANLETGLELTRRTLRSLGAPRGSELHFARECVVPIVDC